ncbi:MAG: PspC domain-containing protein [Tannerellaceae bacterium]|nr:PspC domain-containing protein [Tannerellaceae bacterium]
MKKTLTVNLGGRVFHIDEDAYLLLDKYLTNLHIHFRKEEGSEEILEDFESRISELFSEYIKLGYDVIPLARVEEVIRQMGRPEEIFGEDYIPEEDQKEEEKKKKSTTERIKETVSRRLYRNPDDKVLGGVASGVAAYMGWDPAIVRLVWFLLVFVYGVAVPIYFVLWIVVPMAQTATEKLQMRGESITVENIGKTVTDGFDKASNNFNEYITSGETKSVFSKMADFFVEVIGILVKFVFVCFSIIFLPVMLLLLFIFVMVFGSLMVGGTGLLMRVIPNIDWSYFSGYPDGSLLVFSFCSILVLGIPLVSGIYAIISYFFKFKPVKSGVKWTLLIIWVIALFITMYVGTFLNTADWWELLDRWDVDY